MRDSIITTVYDRSYYDCLRHTFYQLRRQDLRDTELIVVNDGSRYDYTDAKAYLAQHEVQFEWIDVNTCEDRPGTYHLNCSCGNPRESKAGCRGLNNPAYAWNVALEAAKGARITMLASDCLIPLNAMSRARRFSRNCVYMASVMDVDSGMLYLGKQRIAPYGWFATWRREDVGEIRQDEAFLKGLAWDDTDFSARLALAGKTLMIDLATTCIHQSHAPVAYSDGMLGHDINERYIIKKWGGLPWFNNRVNPLKVRERQDEEKLYLTVSKVDRADRDALLEKHGFA